MENQISIKTNYITLGQFLKLAGIIDTGGAVKWFLSDHEIFVNGEEENRRGKKLFHDDKIVITGIGTFKIISNHEKFDSQ